ncbi:MAG TPA: sigma-70 family RNA polymerase sigma factor [Thermoanaerobaculia bacterium]|nr:sigma-70 family RNA polymerase sigma factor [Thermoanaerobaculia bacterium]
MTPDAALVASALAGSERAFYDLVRRYERPVYALVLRMVRDPALAEDLAQEVFVKAHRALGAYDSSRKLSSWLFKIAHNTALDHLRRPELATVALEAGVDDRRDWADVLVDASAPDPEAAAGRRDLARALSAAIVRLRPEYRAAVVLRFQEGLSYQEIAEALDQPLGTVKTNLHRARKALAVLMTEAGWAPPRETLAERGA